MKLLTFVAGVGVVALICDRLPIPVLWAMAVSLVLGFVLGLVIESYPW